MGATNTTANYSLSQFIGTDKPAWLQDYNGDMLKIDTGINAAKVAADGAQNSASAAQNDANTANSAITNTINPAISSLNTTVGNQGGAINTINSLIGNGTPTTTDQTIIGAINEINASLKKCMLGANEITEVTITMPTFPNATELSTGLTLVNARLIGGYITKSDGYNTPLNYIWSPNSDSSICMFVKSNGSKIYAKTNDNNVSGLTAHVFIGSD